MSVVLLDTTVASLLHPKKKDDWWRAKYEPHMRDMVGHSMPGLNVITHLGDEKEGVTNT